MPQEVRLWQIGEGDQLSECAQASLSLESRLEEWLSQDISVLSPELLVIGRQVETAYGGYIDLLCIDRWGDLVIVELKRDQTPREITAQTLDYASWVKSLSREAIVAIAGKHLRDELSLEDAFRQKFGEELPESVNESHRMVIVASRIDPSSERIIKYLSDSYGVNINAVTFHYFNAAEGKQFVARVFLIDPEEVEAKTRPGKRARNLSYEELDQLAAQKGKAVDDIYQRLVSGLGEHLQKHTRRRSISFSGLVDGGRKAIISILPEKSDTENELRYQIYLDRFKNLFGLSEDQARALLPAVREDWKYYESAGPDYSGFQGYFANGTEVDRFLKGLPERKVGLE